MWNERISRSIEAYDRTLNGFFEGIEVLLVIPLLIALAALPLIKWGVILTVAAHLWS